MVKLKEGKVMFLLGTAGPSFYTAYVWGKDNKLTPMEKEFQPSENQE
jgi:hypothetical protein